MSEYFPKLKLFAGKVKVELDLYNYATKADITVSNLLKKLTIRQKLMELNKKKKKLLIMIIVIRILLHKNLMS